MTITNFSWAMSLGQQAIDTDKYFIDFLTWLIADADIDPRCDKELLTITLMYDADDLECRYDNAFAFKRAINAWFARHKYWISHLYDTLDYDYNPIENYNLIEEGTRHEEGDSVSGGTNSGNNNGVDEYTVSAMNSSTYQPKDKHMVNGNNSGQFSNSNEFGTEGGHTLTRHGNIGVVTTQRLIESERKIIDIDIIKEIVDRIVAEMFVLVW